MTMAQVQPLNIPTPSELAKARDFLCESAILVADVKSLLSDSSHLRIAARLKDILDQPAFKGGKVDRF
jgi:SepF-like predicted cell division protein (DUF552 family)